jgi:hypothetical protein
MGADVEQDFAQGLNEYAAAVASALGIGLEACVFDLDTPASVYVAIDWRPESFPPGDLALLWDERYGWAAAVEASRGEDLTVVAHIGGPALIPEPSEVVRFLADLRAGDHGAGRLDPSRFRDPGRHEELVELLGDYR